MVSCHSLHGPTVNPLRALGLSTRRGVKNFGKVHVVIKVNERDLY